MENPFIKGMKDMFGGGEKQEELKVEPEVEIESVEGTPGRPFQEEQAEEAELSKERQAMTKEKKKEGNSGEVTIDVDVE